MPLKLQRVKSGDGGGGIRLGNIGSAAMNIRRTKSRDTTFNRRQSEMNIIGTEFVVSTEYTLKMIQDARKDKNITKLELEDLILKDSIKESTQIQEAVTKLLAKDGGREWKYIKFLDQIEIRPDLEGTTADYAASQLRQYSSAKEVLWSKFGKHSQNKPIMFQVKLVFHEEVELTQTQELLRALIDSAGVARVEFAGALFNTSPERVPPKLAQQFSSSGANNNKYTLDEMVLLTVTWNKNTKTCPSRIKSLLNECIDKLQGRSNGEDFTASMMDDSSNRSSGVRRKDMDNSNNRSSGRRKDRMDNSSNRASGGRKKDRMDDSNRASNTRRTKSHSPTRPKKPKSKAVRATTTSEARDTPSSSPSSSPYDGLKVSELRALCTARGIDTSVMVEKKEMVDALSK